MNLGWDVHRAAALCLECAVDRYRQLDSVDVVDECAAACTVATTDLLTEITDPISTAAVLMRCAYACDAVAVDGGPDVEQYCECARMCWGLAGELTAARLEV